MIKQSRSTHLAPTLAENVLVAASGLSVAYAGGAVLADIDLLIEEGDLLGIVGPSGSGKTTLLRALLGGVRPSRGDVVRRARLSVGFVPQVETIDWTFPVTVAECVWMARCRKFTKPWITKSERNEIEHALDRLGLSGLANRHIRDLSGGQQQRVFIARAMFTNADLILLDEPTSGLDVQTRHEVLHLLADLNADGVSVVLSTHDLNGIAAHMPTVVCLNKRIVAAGRPNEVLTPEVLEATYGSPMQILEHAGMRVVVEAGWDADVIPLPKRAG